MTTLGYLLSCEEHPAPRLLEQAALAEQAGFQALWISDHFHPWTGQQGQSPFVWAVLGGLARVTSLPVTTAVTCPTVRLHPALVAQAAATVETLMPGRLRLSLGSGEALNEHILGGNWPAADLRLEMLEEAITLIRRLFEGGSVTHRGKHFTADRARLYSLPEAPPPIYVSGFGPKSAALAGRIGDGYCGTQPDPDLLRRFDEAGGRGKPKQGGLKVCWSHDEAKARETAHRVWATDALPGELAQLLPTPSHFEQASALVTEEQVAERIVCGADVELHLAAIRTYQEAGYSGVYVSQVGPEQEGFLDFYRREVLPRLD